MDSSISTAASSTVHKNLAVIILGGIVAVFVGGLILLGVVRCRRANKKPK
jgi:hypothetical protein